MRSHDLPGGNTKFIYEWGQSWIAPHKKFILGSSDSGDLAFAPCPAPVLRNELGTLEELDLDEGNTSQDFHATSTSAHM